MTDEIHDLPDTATARGRWVGVWHRPRCILCVVYGISRSSGWDMVAEWDVIWHHPPVMAWF